MNDSSDRSKRADGIWSTVGKVGAALAAVLALLNILGQLRTDAAKLTSRCTITEVADHPGTVAVHTAATVCLFAQPTSAESGDGEEESGYHEELIRRLEAFVRRDPRYLVHCEIINNGTRPAKNAVLVASDTPLEVFRNGESVADDQIDRQAVKLGNLRAGEEVDLALWFDRGPIAYADQKDFSLTDDDHVGTVLVGRLVYGKMAAVAGFFEVFFEEPWLLMVLVLSIFFVLGQPLLERWGKHRRAKETVDAPEPPSEQMPPSDSA